MRRPHQQAGREHKVSVEVEIKVKKCKSILSCCNEALRNEGSVRYFIHKLPQIIAQIFSNFTLLFPLKS